MSYSSLLLAEDDILVGAYEAAAERDARLAAWEAEFAQRPTHFEIDELALQAALWDEAKTTNKPIRALLVAERAKNDKDYHDWLEDQNAKDPEIIQWLQDSNWAIALVKAEALEELVPHPTGKQKFNREQVIKLLQAVCWLSSAQNSDLAIADYRTLAELLGLEAIGAHSLARTAVRLGFLELKNDGRAVATRMRVLVDLSEEDYSQVRKLIAETDPTQGLIELGLRLPWATDRITSQNIQSQRADWKAGRHFKQAEETAISELRQPGGRVSFISEREMLAIRHKTANPAAKVKTVRIERACMTSENYELPWNFDLFVNDPDRPLDGIQGTQEYCQWIVREVHKARAEQARKRAEAASEAVRKQMIAKSQADYEAWQREQAAEKVSSATRQPSPEELWETVKGSVTIDIFENEEQPAAEVPADVSRNEQRSSMTEDEFYADIFKMLARVPKVVEPERTYNDELYEDLMRLIDS